jgi:hypothetical protein
MGALKDAEDPWIGFHRSVPIPCRQGIHNDDVPYAGETPQVKRWQKRSIRGLSRSPWLTADQYLRRLADQVLP